jgi:hypothetical protein
MHIDQAPSKATFQQFFILIVRDNVSCGLALRRFVMKGGCEMSESGEWAYSSIVSRVVNLVSGMYRSWSELIKLWQFCRIAMGDPGACQAPISTSRVVEGLMGA